MSQLDDQITGLQTEMTNDTTVIESAVTFIQGVPALIAAAIAQALSAGATPAQLQPLTDLQNGLVTNDATLQEALTAQTPTPPPPWPDNSPSFRPVARSNSRMGRLSLEASPVPAASVFPSGETAHDSIKTA